MINRIVEFSAHNKTIVYYLPGYNLSIVVWVGLVPILWAVGTGSDVMKRIAAPRIGGNLTRLLLELMIYPPVYQLWKWHGEVKRQLAS